MLEISFNLIVPSKLKGFERVGVLLQACLLFTDEVYDYHAQTNCRRARMEY